MYFSQLVHQIITYRKLATIFQRAKDESHTLPLSFPKGGSEMLLRCFTDKTDILSIKLSYEDSLR